MYEKLDKLRAEVKRWEQKIEDDKAKLRQAQDKLKEAEHSQILSDLGQHPLQHLQADMNAPASISVQMIASIPTVSSVRSITLSAAAMRKRRIQKLQPRRQLKRRRNRRKNGDRLLLMAI